MSAGPHIVIVEDDPEIRHLLTGFLGRQGCRADAVGSGAALDAWLLRHGEPDILVLDLMLPGEDGLSICRRVRAVSALPILILTAKGEDIDRIVGLEIGADDYMAKPFNPRELLARIRAILRRNEIKTLPQRRLRVGELRIDLDGRAVVKGDSGTAIELTSAEFDLLECFVTRPGRVLSRDQLMDWTRGRRAEATDRTIDVQLSRLRKKIDPDDAGLIKTLRNAGYMLTAEVSPW
jgi:two-component system OmpR family response regulator